jgi:hypothetical protein
MGLSQLKKKAAYAYNKTQPYTISGKGNLLFFFDMQKRVLTQFALNVPFEFPCELH